MDDKELIGLYFGRDERAVAETMKKYGTQLGYLAGRLLSDKSDVEECLNDTYFKVWNAIPPHRPDSLYAFCAAVCRRTAINMIEKRTADRRNACVVELTAEMEQCIPDDSDTRSEDDERLEKLMNDFLGTLDDEKRSVFILRYWYGESSASIAQKYGYTETKIRSMLFRTRKQLKQYLKGKDVEL